MKFSFQLIFLILFINSTCAIPSYFQRYHIPSESEVIIKFGTNSNSNSVMGFIGFNPIHFNSITIKPNNSLKKLINRGASANDYYLITDVEELQLKTNHQSGEIDIMRSFKIEDRVYVNGIQIQPSKDKEYIDYQEYINVKE